MFHHNWTIKWQVKNTFLKNEFHNIITCITNLAVLQEVLIMKLFYTVLHLLFFTATGIAQYGYVDGLSASQMGYKINDQKTAHCFRQKRRLH